MDDKHIRTIVSALEFWQKFNQEAISNSQGESILGYYEIDQLKEKLLNGEHKARMLVTTTETGEMDYIWDGEMEVHRVNVTEIKDDLEWYLENNPRLPLHFKDLARAMELPDELVATIEGEFELVHDNQLMLSRFS